MKLEATDRNVFILGAGFSADAGAPLIHDFLDRARELYLDPQAHMNDQERKKFEDVFEFRSRMSKVREKMDIDLDNIEQLFGLVEISIRLGQTERRTRDNMVYLIAKTLEITTMQAYKQRSRIGFQLTNPLIHSNRFEHFRHRIHLEDAWYKADLYDFFACLLTAFFDREDYQRNRNSSVITFNYDMVLDNALLRMGVAPEYRLDKANDTRVGIEQVTNRIEVLKLHGSTNWAICPSCQKHVKIVLGRVTDHAEQFIGLACPTCPQQELHPLLVPPSWDKSEYAEILRPVWKKAVEELKSATRICIIGYSVPEVDAFFRYLLTLGLSENTKLSSLIAVDYDKMSRNPEHRAEDTERPRTTVRQTWKGLLSEIFHERRFIYHSGGFAQFLCDSGSLGQLGRGEIIYGARLPFGPKLVE